LPDKITLNQALDCLSAALERAGPNRARVREVLASGESIAGVRFDSSGEILP
jgi:hypothetical protein